MKSEAVSVTPAGSRLADLFALTKPRLNSLVVLSTGVGYLLGSSGQIDIAALLHTAVGSTLVAGGAAAFNQVAERDIDEVMVRTRGRPMPSGRVHPTVGRLFAGTLALLGTAELALAANVLSAAVALATLVIYVLIYTPLKRRTPWATVVGAVPGALPPVIGWAAARGSLDAGGWTLFAIVFLWQLPHFHALAWMYRDDFKRANLPLLAVLDTDGSRNARHALVYAVLLIPISLTPSLVGLTGRLYAGAAVGFSVAFAILCWRFLERRSTQRARALFLGSLVYLPLLWTVLVVDGVF